MNSEQTRQSLSTPVKIGIITGVLYCILIYCQNQFFSSNPIQFAATKIVSYLVILALIFYAGFLSKKQMVGFITFQECLKSMLLVIAIAELFYLVFSTIYVKYIDPNFFVRLKSLWQEFFIKNNVPQDQINKSLERFNDAGKITFWGVIQSYGFSIIIDAIFACVFALILKKPKPITEP